MNEPSEPEAKLDRHGTGSDAAPRAHVVLHQPEIPQNTGNIGRTCVAMGCKLWLVHPLGFTLEEHRLRRAGLDYWPHLDFEEAEDWPSLRARLPTTSPRTFYFSKSARRTIWDANFEPGDALVFGRESAGLPASILDRDSSTALRIPMIGPVRSLNLAVAVGIVVSEHARQTTGCKP